MSSTKPSRRNRIELLPTPDERRIIDRMHNKANRGKKRGERISMSRFILSLVLSQKDEERAKAEAYQDAIDLSDKIEMEGDTSLEEWKAFKHFRNTLRDRLKQL